MLFELLSEENLQQVIDVVRLIFPKDTSLSEDDFDNPIMAYHASIYPKKFRHFWENFNLKTLEYFIVKDEKTNEIIGVTGIYTKTTDLPDVAWLGWYGVHPEKRGFGFGEEILNWTMKMAKERGFIVMKLYTSNDPNEAAAQKLYDKMGFKITNEEILLDKFRENYKIIYREKNL